MATGSTAGDVMTTGAATVLPDASLADAARILVEYRISGLPVVTDQGDLVGIVTEHDFLRREDGARPRWLDVLLSDAAGRISAGELKNRKVKDVMTKDPVTVDAGTPVEAVFELMERHRIKRLPVMRNGKVAGILSRADLLQAIMRKAGRASRA